MEFYKGILGRIIWTTSRIDYYTVCQQTNTMKLSITLPSIHPKALERTLQNIHATTRCEHEIIVVSPFVPEVYDGYVVWVKDFIMEGCNAGHALGLTEATGEFIFPWVDDHLLIDDWDVVAITEFEARESVLHSRPFMLGLRHQPGHLPAELVAHVGTCFGIYYPHFPFMRTADARRLGWFKPEYRVGFGDVDLAMRMWVSGGWAEWSTYETLIRHDDDRAKVDKIGCTPEDMKLFLDRWSSIYGCNWSMSKDTWTHPREFNKAIPLHSMDFGSAGARTFSPDRRAHLSNENT
jgi:hypothetical protein